MQELLTSQILLLSCGSLYMSGGLLKACQTLFYFTKLIYNLSVYHGVWIVSVFHHLPSLFRCLAAKMRCCAICDSLAIDTFCKKGKVLFSVWTLIKAEQDWRGERLCGYIFKYVCVLSAVIPQTVICLSKNKSPYTYSGTFQECIVRKWKCSYPRKWHKPSFLFLTMIELQETLSHRTGFWICLSVKREAYLFRMTKLPGMVRVVAFI